MDAVGPGSAVSILGLVATCDLVHESPREAHFAVAEHLDLSDGRRVRLHEERGFGGRSSSPHFAPFANRSDVENSVLTTVLPDDAEETGEDHPWAWLADLAAAQGLAVTVEQLRAAPYRVELSERVLARFGRIDALPPS